MHLLFVNKVYIKESVCLLTSCVSFYVSTEYILDMSEI